MSNKAPYIGIVTLLLLASGGYLLSPLYIEVPPPEELCFWQLDLVHFGHLIWPTPCN